MDKIAGFFRIFDLAFFAPGAVLFIALWEMGYLDHFNFNAKLNTAEGVVITILAIALIYLLGLVCHGIQRHTIRPLVKRYQNKFDPKFPNDRPSALFNKLQPQSGSDLATYFWYMRAISWNLSVALILSGLLYGGRVLGAQIPELIIGFGLLIGIVFLIWIGVDFQRAMRRAPNREGDR